MAAGPRRAEGRSLRRWAYCAGATLPVPRLCERFAAVKYGSRSLSARAGKQFYDWRAQAESSAEPVLFDLDLSP